MTFFKKSKTTIKGGARPEPSGGEARRKTYEERMDEITRWNVEHTDIIEVLRGQIQEERLILWSRALRIGIRRAFKKPEHAPASPQHEAFRDLDQFIMKQRVRLLGNRTMRQAKGMGKMDPVSVCIICGIRALQRQTGVSGLVNTIKVNLVERYLAGTPYPGDSVQFKRRRS